LNGPEHYQEAERLISASEHSQDHETYTYEVAAAAVHAVLAVAAALITTSNTSNGLHPWNVAMT
jgi:hypothetical protein